MEIILDIIISLSDNHTLEINRSYRGMKGTDIRLPKGIRSLDEITRHIIVQTLQATGGNKKAAAEALQIYRPRLYSLMRRYAINVKRR
jgi:DNA-binding NtrC family response regulator